MAIVESTYLDRLLAPVTQCFTPEIAERLVGLRTDPDAETRIEELASKANEGQLSSEERAEYDNYVDAVDLIGILQTRAPTVLAKRVADQWTLSFNNWFVAGPVSDASTFIYRKQLCRRPPFTSRNVSLLDSTVAMMIHPTSHWPAALVNIVWPANR